MKYNIKEKMPTKPHCFGSVSRTPDILFFNMEELNLLKKDSEEEAEISICIFKHKYTEHNMRSDI